MKVPAFLGSSFAFLGGFFTIANLRTGMYAQMGANEKAAYACGGIVVAGALYLVLAAITRAVGVSRVMRFLPPIVTGPVIICIGLVITAEILNTCIEKLCDLYSTDYSNRIREIKDLAAGAVLAASLTAFITAMVILFSHIGG
jgi:diacylglycerol kinase